MKTDVKDLNYYLSLGYKIEITPDEDGDGWNIPDPIAEPESDSFMLPLPSDLHHELTEQAQKSQTSLNNFIISQLLKARPVALPQNGFGLATP